MNRLSTIALSSVLLFAFSGCERPKNKMMEPPPSAPIPVNVLEVKTGNFPMTLTASGQTQGSNTAQIYARVGGYLQKIHYTEGSKVHAGDLLFSLDPSDLLNALDSAKATVMQAQVAHDNALIVLNRVKPLSEAHASSQQELDNALASEKTTAAALVSTKAALAQAKLNLSYASVRAPIDGYADKRKIDIGTYVTPGASALLTSIYATDPLYVNFSLSENQKIAFQNAITAGKLSAPANKKYVISLTLGDGSVVTKTGTIDFVAPFFDPASGTISYRATLENRDNKLLPGQFVRVSVKGMEWSNSVYLPQKVVLTGDKGKFVYILEANNTVTPRAVQAGEWIGENLLIFSGLNGGETIVTDGLTKLRPGGDVIPPHKAGQ